MGGRVGRNICPKKPIAFKTLGNFGEDWKFCVY